MKVPGDLTFGSPVAEIKLAFTCSGGCKQLGRGACENNMSNNLFVAKREILGIVLRQGTCVKISFPVFNETAEYFLPRKNRRGIHPRNTEEVPYCRVILARNCYRAGWKYTCISKKHLERRVSLSM